MRGMIGHVDGRLAEKFPPLIVIDCAGVGYEVHVPMSTFYALPALGERCKLLTTHIVREDAQLLFGFATRAERAAFAALLKVSGVGPKVALAVLSGLSVSELAQAIAQQSTARLTKVPGVGKKTAERLLLELKGKLDFGGEALMGGAPSALGAAAAGSGAALSDTHADIVQALLGLGYNEREAAAALKSLPPDVDVASGIRLALQSLL